MDTAAAAAAAVVVDLNAEKKSSNTTKLLAKPKLTTNHTVTATPTPCSNQTEIEHETVECLGSSGVEAMSVTPPPTPAHGNEVGHSQTEPNAANNEAAPMAMPMPATSTTSTTALNGLICRKDSTKSTGPYLGTAADSAEYFGLIAHHQQPQPHPHLQLQPQPQELAASLTPSTSTSSTNASTTPTSALLTTTTTPCSTAPATPSSGSNSANASLQASSSNASTRCVEATPAQLLQWQDMPQYLQFNPYVLKGYRPLQTFKGCLLSLFYWHNETINILTHAIPIVYILAIVPGLMPWERGYRFLSFCHVFGSVAPWCGSFVYHLFMNIEKGENVYYRLLKLDMVGIWVSQSFGALPLVTATTLCFTPKLKWLIIISYCLLSLWGLYKALTASSPWQRRLCFALPFSMRSVLTFLRIRGLVGGSHMALSHVYLQDGVSILGGAIGAMRIPEKWFPGLVDFYLNSHNIMHVLVVVAVYSMHKATIKDFEWMSTQTCYSYGNATEDSLGQGHVEL